MSTNNLLCKYLEAGAKSSAVVLDPALATCNEQTLYLYNQQRNQIIEYKRDIVEAKLRDLSSEEAKMVEALQQAYDQARSTFTPRGAAILNIPETSPPVVKTPKPVGSDDDVDADADIDDVALIEDDDDDDDDTDEDESY
jgi:hypothetical protein